MRSNTIIFAINEQLLFPLNWSYRTSKFWNSFWCWIFSFITEICLAFLQCRYRQNFLIVVVRSRHLTNQIEEPKKELTFEKNRFAHLFLASCYPYCPDVILLICSKHLNSQVIYLKIITLWVKGEEQLSCHSRSWQSNLNWGGSSQGICEWGCLEGTGCRITVRQYRGVEGDGTGSNATCPNKGRYSDLVIQ